MKVFVTGGSGLIGSNVILELIAKGHTVNALARSDASIAKVKSLGATPIKGSQTDLSVLSEQASIADAVLHLAFNNEAIVGGDVATACKEEKEAIKAMCDALVNTNKSFVASGGMLGAIDTDENGHFKLPFPRLEIEPFVLSYVEKSVKANNIRLSPVTHAAGIEHPFISVQIAIAKKTGVAGYIGDGSKAWCAVHAKDAAALYVLAIEKGLSGKNLHAAAELKIPTKTIAEYIGKKLNVPVKSITPEEAAASGYGFVAMVMNLGGEFTTKLTREWTGWEPKQPGLFATIETYKW